MKAKIVLLVTIPSMFLMALFVFALSPPAPVHAAGFVVTHAFDDDLSHDANPGDGICSDLGNICTLRAAIEEANAHSGTDTITFGMVMTITIGDTEGALPDITDPVIIDASGVWDAVNDSPGVVLSGGSKEMSGLFLQADANQIYGLHVTRFNWDGILIISANNQIGGVGVGQRNIISGNGSSGIHLSGTTAHHNLMLNNYVGIKPNGIEKDANNVGIVLNGGASSNSIGSVLYKNVISGNTEHGVYISDVGTDANEVISNYIGSTADGNGVLSNGKTGVYVVSGAGNTHIGGSIGKGNLIIGNGASGIGIQVVSGVTRIEDNIVTANKQEGILIAGSNARVAYNEIIANTYSGITVWGNTATGNLLSQNRIFVNGFQGIDLSDGGNGNVSAPTITSATPQSVSGTACPLCKVELFSDKQDQGEFYEGFAMADANGNWQYAGNLVGPNVTATATDGNDNTSAFSLPKSTTYNLFLPTILKP